MFIVYNYQFDHSSDFDPKYTEVETLEEAREEAKRRLGDLDEWRRWMGHEDDDSEWAAVEAYHESREDLCGGVHISRQA